MGQRGQRRKSAGPSGAHGCEAVEPDFHPSVFPSILASFHPSFHPSICLFPSFQPSICPDCLLLVGPTARQITTKNHVPLLLGLPEFACGSSAVHIFAFELHQARTYMHHTCHSTAICPKSPQSGTKVPPKCSKVTPKCPPSSSKLIK